MRECFGECVRVIPHVERNIIAIFQIFSQLCSCILTGQMRLCILYGFKVIDPRCVTLVYSNVSTNIVVKYYQLKRASDNIYKKKWHGLGVNLAQETTLLV